MDPLSITSSIIGGLQTLATLINTCYDYQSAVKEAPKDLERTTSQLISVRNLLEDILGLAKNEEFEKGLRQVSILGVLSQPDGPLFRLRIKLNNLAGTLKPLSNEWKQTRSQLFWPLTEDQAKKILDDMELAKATLNLALKADRESVTNAIKNDVVALQDGPMSMSQLTELARQDEWHKVLRWLLPPDAFSNHKDACRRRVQATGAWFTEGEQFSEWKNGSDQLLWIHANAGCGKTILCSNVIEEILRHCEQDPLLAGGCFYFDFNDREKQRCEGLIRSLIVQFSSQCPALPDPLVKLYAQHQKPGRQPTQASPAALLATLKEILEGFRHSYIMIDALDECAEMEKLFSLIQEITGWKLGNLHILVTSRKEQEIADRLDPLVTCQIGIQSAVVKEDIRAFVHERIAADRKLRRWLPKVKEEIELALAESADGVFRWIECQLDALRTCMKPDAVKRALKALPKTLDESYDRILMSIEDEYREDTFKVFMWLAYSTRPVTIEEVAEVLGVNFDSRPPRFIIDQRLPEPNDLLTICSTMVTVSSSILRPGERYSSDLEGDPQTEQLLKKSEIRLAHSSVRDYMTSNRILGSPVSWYSRNKKSPDVFMSQICLAYLLQFKEPLTPSRIQTFPLAHHVAQYWYLHAQSDDSAGSEDLQQMIMDLFQPQSVQYANWIHLYNPDFPAFMEGLDTSVMFVPPPNDIIDPTSDRSPVQPLYYAAMTGLKETVKRLLAMGVDVNARGGYYGSALQAASLAGHEAIVQLLLNKGADVNIQGGHHGSALQAASSVGYMATVKILLDNGANVNAQGGHDVIALQAALSGGHQTNVQMLLDSGADANM